MLSPDQGAADTSTEVSFISFDVNLMLTYFFLLNLKFSATNGLMICYSLPPPPPLQCALKVLKLQRANTGHAPDLAIHVFVLAICFCTNYCVSHEVQYLHEYDTTHMYFLCSIKILS